MDKHSVNNLLIKINNNSLDFLDDYINMIEKKFNVNINVHDVVGINLLAPSLEKAFSTHKYHNNCFCNYVKKNHRCLELCMSNKSKLCYRCKKVTTAFYDSCYMGIEELIYPVMCDKKLIAIICIGQFFSNMNISKKTIHKNCSLYNLKKDETENNFVITTRSLDLNLETLHCYISMLIQHLCLSFKLTLENKINNKSNAETDKDILSVHKNNFIISTTTYFIKENYEKPLTLKLLANNSYCNSTYLSHIFKEKMSTSLTDYINNVRIQNAKELIDLTSKSITEISMKVGFNDLGYFGRVFKNVIGLSPKKYREKNT